MDSHLLYLPHTSHLMYYLEAEGMNALNDTQHSFQIPFSLACGLCWGCSLAATGHSLRSLLWNRHLFQRCLSSCGLPFWILFHPFGLTPLFVHLHCQGEHEVGFYVPVLLGRRPEAYRHPRPLPHALENLLRLILQHGCSGIPSEMRKGDLMNRLPPGSWLHTVWSLKPQNQRGASSSPVLSMASLLPASRKTGCGIATGMTSLISKAVTSMKWVESSFSGKSSQEPAACQTCRCM